MAIANPCPDPSRLRELLDGSIPEAEQAELTAHLETCESCQQTVEGLVAGRDSWIGAARQLGAGAAPLAPTLQSAMEHARHTPPPVEPATEFDAHVELPRDFLAPPDEPGHLGKLAHYEVFDVIGRGAMGIVLRAFDQKLHRVVAIKVMSPQLASSASARKRFIREGQAAAAVCHEHVVTIHAVEEAHGLPYLVMQFVGGVSLQDRLDANGPLELREILRIGMQTAEGLAAAHAQGLVHRDIKPSNILLENGVERVKITDFGLARAVDDASLTQTGVIAGTPQYMAPEQAHGTALDHRADLFSLGSVLYALCAGRAPFRSSTMMAVLKRVCEETPRPIREINPDIPEWLVAMIGKLHAKNPSDRFQSAKAVADLLGQYLAHLQRPDQVARPEPVTVPTSAQHSAGTARIPVAEEPRIARANLEAVTLQYRARMLVAGLMAGLAFGATVTGLTSPAESFLRFSFQLLPAVALFVLLMHAIARRLLTGHWRETLVGLLAIPAAPGTASDGFGHGYLGTRTALILIVSLLGSAACFAAPMWLPFVRSNRFAVAFLTASGWLLVAHAFFRSASALRKPPASKQRGSVDPAMAGAPPRQFTLQRAVMIAVIAVCAMIVLVPIGLAVIIGGAWLGYRGLAVPASTQVHIPAAFARAGSELPGLKVSAWDGSDVERSLLGRWIVVSQESRGAQVPDEARFQWLQFGSVGDTNRFAESSPSGQLTLARYIVERTLTGEQAAIAPADEDHLSKVVISDDGVVELRHGVFRIDGDTLSLCLASTELPSPESLHTDDANGAVLYVLKRDKPSEAKTAGDLRDSIAGTWSSNWGDATFEHEPVQNNAVVRVTGSLASGTTQTRMPFEGTFDPALGQVVLTFEKGFLPSLTGRGGLKLSSDGSELIGIYDLSLTSLHDTHPKLHWELKRKPKLPDVPASAAEEKGTNEVPVEK